MKKITFLLALFSTAAIAQTNYSEVATISNTTNNGSNEGSIERVDNNRQPIVDSYTSLADFNAGFADECGATSDDLVFEDMVGGPGAITPCGAVISSDGDGCFAAGELQEGFSVSTSAGDVIYIPAGAIGNTDPLVGAATFADFTVISFTEPVYSVAFDLWENNDPTTIIRVFGDGGEIETFNADTPVNTQTFFGFISDEGITAIELEGNADSGELFGNFYFGVDCDLLNTQTVTDTQISMYPNPANDLVTISLDSGIELESITLTDVLGKTQQVDITNNSLSVASLTKGVYLVTINTDRGSIVQKLIVK